MTQSITAKEVSKRVENERENIISLLRDILRIPSVTGEETEIQNYFSKYLSGLGLEVDVWEPDLDRLKNHPAFVPVKKDYKGRPNVVAVLRGSGGGKSLIFNGHVDVIPPGPEKPGASVSMGRRDYKWPNLWKRGRRYEIWFSRNDLGCKNY